MSCPKGNYHQERRQRIAWLLELSTASTYVRVVYHVLTHMPLLVLGVLVVLVNFGDTVKGFCRIPNLWPYWIDKLITEDDKWIVLTRRAKVDVETDSVNQLRWSPIERIALCVTWLVVIGFIAVCSRNILYTVMWALRG